MFHVLVDTSFLFKAHFAHPDFQKLLLRSQEGKIKIHIPHIVLEEQRTRILVDIHDKLRRARKAFDDAKRAGAYAMFTDSLPDPHMFLWSDDDVDQRSKQVMHSFVVNNKIDILSLSPDHATRAWTRYFDAAPPFNPQEADRVERRKDIPDSWILEAALDLKSRGGNLCALCGDGRLKDALKAEGFEIFDDAQALADRVDAALAVYPPRALTSSDTPLTEQLRSSAFKGVDVAVLGFVEAFDTPPKEKLFDLLEKVGFGRRIAENVAETLVLSGVLQDSGNYLLASDRALAQRAAAEVQHLVLKLLAGNGP